MAQAIAFDFHSIPFVVFRFLLLRRVDRIAESAIIDSFPLYPFFYFEILSIFEIFYFSKFTK